MNRALGPTMKDTRSLSLIQDRPSGKLRQSGFRSHHSAQEGSEN